MKYGIKHETSETEGFGLNINQLKQAGVDAWRMNRVGKQIVRAKVGAQQVEVLVYFSNHNNEDVFVDPNYLQSVGLPDLNEIEFPS